MNGSLMFKPTLLRWTPRIQTSAAFKVQKSLQMWVLRLDDKASTPDRCRSPVSRPFGEIIVSRPPGQMSGKKRSKVFVVVTRVDFYGGVSEPR